MKTLLLDGMVTDIQRPTQRELEVTSRLAELLAEKLGDRATIQAAPPAHPERRRVSASPYRILDVDRWQRIQDTRDR